MRFKLTRLNPAVYFSYIHSYILLQFIMQAENKKNPIKPALYTLLGALDNDTVFWF